MFTIALITIRYGLVTPNVLILTTYTKLSGNILVNRGTAGIKSQNSKFEVRGSRFEVPDSGISGFQG
jgi:hypothetical protein